MKLVVVAVGESMPAWADAAFADYARRMPRTARIELTEVRAEPRRGGRTAAQLMAAEALRIEAAVPAGSLRVALDERGRDPTTRELAALVERWRDDGRNVAFLIGGPDGLDPGLKEKSDLLLRLSSLTLPHALARVVLAEQLYRVMSLVSGHPYHRD